jgi:hypothetical protein
LTQLPPGCSSVVTIDLVFQEPDIALTAAGIVVATIGACLPARWAARAAVVEVLHAE